MSADAAAGYVGAIHWLRSREVAPALKYLLEVGEQAFLSYTLAEALRFYRDAQEVTQRALSEPARPSSSLVISRHELQASPTPRPLSLTLARLLGPTPTLPETQPLPQIPP